MYEPIRARSVHTMTEPAVPRQSRAEHLRSQLAGHLAALLAVTDELRAIDGTQDLTDAAREIAERIAQLSPETAPVRIWEGTRPGDGPGRAALHRQAHTLAGRVLVVAAARQDTTTAMLACRRMEAHAPATPDTAVAPAA
ncbi:SCO4983 family protein [Streptomyces capparidis]